MVGREVIARILSSPDFEAFGSTRPRGQTGASAEWLRRPGTRTELEFNPHDGVHTTLGGDMAQPALASRDPIFFLHHRNIDRLWANWNARGNDNSREPNWLGFAFARHFTNPDGSAWNVTVEDMLSTPALGYRYPGEGLSFAPDNAMDAFAADPVLADPGPSGPVSSVDDAQSDALLEYRRMPEGTLPRSARDLRRITTPSGRTFFMAGADNDQAASRERPVGVAVALGRPLSEVVRSDASVSARPQGQKRARQRVWAVIRDMDTPSDTSTRVRVFVNCGELSPGTPVTDPTYVTSLSFFASGHMDHGAHHGHRAMAQATDGRLRFGRSRSHARPDEPCPAAARRPDCGATRSRQRERIARGFQGQATARRNRHHLVWIRT